MPTAVSNKEAEQEGYEACQDGVPYIDNPYPPGSTDSEAWNSGWNRAREYGERACL